MHILSVREQPEYEQLCIRFFKEHCADEESITRIKDSIHLCIYTESALPQWYLLMDNKKIVGGAGLIANTDNKNYSPWLYNLYIKDAYYNEENVSFLINKIKKDAAVFGYEKLYIYADEKNCVEVHGFNCVQKHKNSNIYTADCNKYKRLSIRSMRKELFHTILLLLSFEFVYTICKVNFFNWAEFLATIGLIVLIISIFFKRHYLSVMTIVGYFAGYGLGAIFHTTTTDSFGRSDNWWMIWTYTYLLFMLVGFLFDIKTRQKNERNLTR